MLVGAHRFHGRGSLNRVYQKGQAARSATLGLKYASRGPNRPYRVAVVVSRKVSKSAVVRNRIRRRVYEAVRTAKTTPQPGTDLVFTAYSDQLAGADSHQLQAAVDQLLQKARY